MTLSTSDCVNVNVREAVGLEFVTASEPVFCFPRMMDTVALSTLFDGVDELDAVVLGRSNESVREVDDCVVCDEVADDVVERDICSCDGDSVRVNDGESERVNVFTVTDTGSVKPVGL